MTVVWLLLAASVAVACRAAAARLITGGELALIAAAAPMAGLAAWVWADNPAVVAAAVFAGAVTPLAYIILCAFVRLSALAERDPR